MSKIRIYDLAKEAGIKSTELADKLIDLGYNIKGHSSTVADEVADEIRRNVLGTVETEVIEKRISTKGRATIIRRRSQTVRRASETSPPAEEEVAADAAADDAAVMAAAEVPVEEKEAIEKSAEKKPVKKTAKKKPVKKKKEEVAADAFVEEEPAEEVTSVTAKKEPEAVIEPEVAAAAAIAAAEETSVEAVSEQEVKDQQPEEAEKQEVKPKPKAVKRVVPPRKGLAKVIKRAAIHIPEEKPKAPARPPRPAKGKGKAPLAEKRPVMKVGETKGAEDSRSGKGKKKGKRLVQFRSGADEQGGRFKKGFGDKRKGRKGFGKNQDYEYGSRGTRGPKGKKKQVEPIQPVAETKAIKKRIKVFETISVGDLAHRMSVKASQVIAKLMGLGVMATVNQVLDVDTAILVATDFGYEVEQGVTEESIVLQLDLR
jgi:translation initiation factor IF-2